MYLEIHIDPSETDVEAQANDTASMVRIVAVRFGKVTLHMDMSTWVLAKKAVIAEAERLNEAIRGDR